jgi:hypothetical protein
LLYLVREESTMAVRDDWLQRVSFTESAVPAGKLEVYGLEWRITASGTVFLRSLKEKGDSMPFENREYFLRMANDVFDTLEIAMLREIGGVEEDER